MPLDQLLDYQTGTSSLAVFDYEALRDRFNDELAWYLYPPFPPQEVASGQMLLSSLEGDGTYRVRVTDGELTQDERDYACATDASQGLSVVSGRVFVGGAEELPSEELEPDELITAEYKQGAFVEVKPDEYSATLYKVAWQVSHRWWSEDGKLANSAPADIVVILTPRMKPFTVLTKEPPRLLASDQFLFASDGREIGPVSGMTLSTTVWKGPNGLFLKECGPLRYRPMLDKNADLKWHDRVKVLEQEVDHAARTMRVEVISLDATQPVTKRPWWKRLHHG